VLAELNPLSIAVLPFAARSSLEDTAFFADGIHDDLLTTLSKVTALKVISRTSVLKYRDLQRDMQSIGQELGAAFIMEGGVQQVGDNVRINVQLIDSRTDGHVWAETYDRALSAENLFAIQSELVENIAEQLKAKLTPDEQERVKLSRTDNLDAFREYMRGRQQIAHSSFDALRKAVEHFSSAIELDPEYVLAHAALADAYAQLALVGAITPAEMLENGQQHVDRAMELDSGNAYVRAVRGRYLTIVGDPEGEQVLKDAAAAAPNDVDVLNIYATWLRRERRGKEALVVLRQALDLDPLSVTLYHDLGRTHLWMGQFQPALQAFERISQIDPGNPYAAHGAGIATILSGQLVQAAHWSEEATALDPVDYENTATSAVIYLSYDDFEMARERVADSLALGPEEPYPLCAKALLLATSGEKDEAVAIARAALAKDLEDRWGSHYTFLRLVRDEALESGNYDEALAWYRKYEPGLFESPPQLDAENLRRAPGLALLLRAAGATQEADGLLHATVAAWEELYTLGSANYPLGIAIVDALALLDQEEAAVSKLRDLYNDGWRMLWRFDTTQNPDHDGLRDNADYQAILRDVETDLQRQVKESLTR
jgi:TolB-like protein/Flp pilus assembly protein TadD